MQKLSVALVVILLAGLGWGLYDTQQALEDSQQQLRQALEQNEQQQQQLELLHKEMVRINQRVSKLDKNSVEGIVREANQAILQGWETLVNTVEEELKKAQEKAAAESSAPPQPPQAPPTLESPDGTDRT